LRRGIAERFLAKLDAALPLVGCREWRRARHRNGYGSLWVGERRTEYAHRVAYKLLVGRIGEALKVDHVCRNRLCVRPEHLELVTHRENVRRAAEAKRAAARSAA
jgi:hypothetical protein